VTLVIHCSPARSASLSLMRPSYPAQIRQGRQPGRTPRAVGTANARPVFAPEALKTTPMPPGQTERPSPGFTTIVGAPISGPFVIRSDVYGADTHFTPAHGHDRDPGEKPDMVASDSGPSVVGDSLAPFPVVILSVAGAHPATVELARVQRRSNPWAAS
jgi:hypothetical protein